MNAAGRILVVEDDPIVREVIELALTEEGFTVDGEGDPVAALERAAGDRPDAILLDLRMPGLSGAEFARRYRQRVARPAPLVLLTAANDAASAAAAIGAARFVRKPFEVVDLVRALREIVSA